MFLKETPVHIILKGAEKMVNSVIVVTTSIRALWKKFFSFYRSYKLCSKNNLSNTTIEIDMLCENHNNHFI